MLKIPARAPRRKMNLGRKVAGLAAVALCAGFGQLARAASVLDFNGSYSQDFDALIESGSAAWTDGVPLLGWNSGATTLHAVNGYTSTADISSLGAAMSSERALGGFVATGGFASSQWGVAMMNNTGSTIDELDIWVDVEQWHGFDFNSGAGLVPITLSVAKQLNAGGLSIGTWDDIPDLAFTPTQYTPGGALDGNAAENRVQLHAKLTGLNWAADEEFWLRWTPSGVMNTGEASMGIDNLVISVPEPGVFSVLVLGAMLGLGFVWIRRARGRRMA